MCKACSLPPPCLRPNLEVVPLIGPRNCPAFTCFRFMFKHRSVSTNHIATLVYISFCICSTIHSEIFARTRCSDVKVIKTCRDTVLKLDISSSDLRVFRAALNLGCHLYRLISLLLVSLSRHISAYSAGVDSESNVQPKSSCQSTICLVGIGCRDER